jgi:hypothetical protein
MRRLCTTLGNARFAAASAHDLGMRFPWSPQLYRIGCVVEPHFSRPLYEHAAWMALFPFVDAVFSAIKTPAFIRSYQTRPGHDANLGFGRMPWSRASNEL